MRIHLCGAAGEVTGSGYLVEHEGRRVLVDFGQFQGSRDALERSRSLGPVDPEALDAVLVTHAHLDHVGRLPLLVRNGAPSREPKWLLHATPPTIELMGLILEDSARLQLGDFERAQERAQMSARQPPTRVEERRQTPEPIREPAPANASSAELAGFGAVPEDPPFAPLFDAADVTRLMQRVRPVDYGAWIDVLPGWRARYRDAGHILGSASIELQVGGRRIVFGGDLGPSDVPILRNPDPPSEADLVFLESTYGDRDHRPFPQTLLEFSGIIERAAWEKAKVLIPAFAVGRTPLILECLSQIYAANMVPKVPIFVDSPMAIRAGEFQRRHHELMDEQAQAARRDGDLARNLSELRVLRTSAESRELNDSWDPGIIIAGSGMCDGGRIMHHLRHHLWRHGVQVVLCGFMAQGTLGWHLLRGAREVRVQGRWIPVRAQVHTLGGFSAHAGQSDLLAWLKPMSNAARVVLVHGENPQRTALAAKIRERFEVEAELPGPGAVIEC